MYVLVLNVLFSWLTKQIIDVMRAAWSKAPSISETEASGGHRSYQRDLPGGPAVSVSFPSPQRFPQGSCTLTSRKVIGLQRFEWEIRELQVMCFCELVVKRRTVNLCAVRPAGCRWCRFGAATSTGSSLSWARRVSWTLTEILWRSFS